MENSGRDISALSRPELEASLLHYRELFEHAPIGIIQSTLDGKILKVNPAAAAMFGYDPASENLELFGNISENLYARPEERRLLLDRARTRQLFVHEGDFRRKDGTIISCRLHVRVVADDGGGIRFLESFIEDVSDRKKTAQALLESERLYRCIFENTGAGSIIIERDMTISFANTGFQKMTGYTKEEIEGRMKWTVFIADPEEMERMVRYHIRRRTDAFDVPIEYEFVLADRFGNRKNILLRVDIIAGTDRSVASLFDITQLKTARRSLVDSEARLKGILDVFDGFIYTCTQGYVLASMNPALVRCLGRDAVGEVCHRAIFGLKEPCSWCSQSGVFAGNSVKAEFQNPRDGRWYQLVGIPVFAADGSVAARQNIAMDIHNRKVEEIAAEAREKHLREENIRLRDSMHDRYRFGEIIGKSGGMQKVYELILRAAALTANVIIHGESGTGKELVAREIHAIGDRSRYPFVPVNCGAIPEHLFESEFFGYRKGAFTGAHQDKPGYFDQAEKGTLFLDELGEISLEMQVKLLRVLEGHAYHPVGGVQSRKPDVRIITATNKNLHELIDRGKMREDFFYRIHIVPIHIPPLRQRKEDIPLLVEHFLQKYKPADRQVPPIMGGAMDLLLGYDWPGNIRELENTIQRYISLNTLDFFYAQSAPARMAAVNGTMDVGPDLPLRTVMDRYEKDYILSLLQRHRWNRTRVAKVLGIERKTLYLKMKDLQITVSAEK